VFASIATCRVDDGDLLDWAASDRRQDQQWSEGVDDPVGGGVQDAEWWRDLAHGQVGTPVGGDQADQLAELSGLKPGERVDPLLVGRRDHLHRGSIDEHPHAGPQRHASYETALRQRIRDFVGILGPGFRRSRIRR
jgi:hypothetical protein